MGLKILKCPKCGQSNLSKEEKHYRCPVCESIIFNDDYKTYEEVVEKLLQEGKEADIGVLRYSLNEELKQTHLNTGNIKNICRQIKSFSPEDIIASFYLAYVERKSYPRNYESYLKTLIQEKVNNYEINQIIPVIINSCDIRVKELIEELLKAHNLYNQENIEKINKALKEREQEIEKYDTEKDVFVCHSSKDNKEIIKIVNVLEDNNISCWYSERNLPWDIENYWEGIHKAIKDCKVFLFVLSKYSKVSKDVIHELDYARSLNKEIRVEYRIDDSENNIPIKKCFDGIQWIDGSKSPKYGELAERIYNRLENIDKEDYFKKEKFSSPKLEVDYNLIKAKMNLKKYKEAIKEIEAQMQINPYDPKLFEMLLEAELEGKNIKNEKATKTFNTLRKIVDVKTKIDIDCKYTFLLSEEDAEQYHILANQALSNKDYALVIKYLTISSKANSEISKYKLANHLFSGDICQSNEKEAFDLYTQLSLNGYKEANYKLGICYEKGVGIEKKVSKAKELFKQAYSSTKELLSNDNSINKEILIKAAESGDAKAQFEYAESLYSESLSSKHKTNYMQWYEKSAENGNDKAKQILEMFNKKAIIDKERKQDRKVEIVKKMLYAIGIVSFILFIASLIILAVNYYSINSLIVKIARYTVYVCPISCLITIVLLYVTVYLDNQGKMYYILSTLASVFFIFCICVTYINYSKKDINMEYDYYIENNVVYLDTDEGLILYSVDKEAKVIEIKEDIVGVRKGALKDCSKLEELTLPNVRIKNFGYLFDEKAEDKGIPRSLKTINIVGVNNEITAHMFEGCSYIENVTLEGIKSIQNSAFRECTSLKNINLGDELIRIQEYAFYLCDTLNNVNIPDSVVYIGNHAFSNCVSLRDITLSNSLSYIGYYAFNNCELLKYNIFNEGNYLGSNENPYLLFVNSDVTNLISYDFHNDTKIINSYAFEGCSTLEKVQIPDGITYIGQDAFALCESLQYETYNYGFYLGNDNNPYLVLTLSYIPDDKENFTIHENTKIILDHAFFYETAIKSVEIPQGLVSIGSSAFSHCESLINIDIPESVINIGDNAFSNCINLRSVSIPSSVVNIDCAVFSDCESLIGLNVDKNNEYYDSSNNCNAIIETATKTLISSCQNTIIPQDILHIGFRAFEYSTIDQIILPNGLISIGERAFAYCSLTKITLPESVIIIEDRAFEGFLGTITTNSNFAIKDVTNWR